MKIALISDIHANLPALEAVLEDIQTHQPDDIYCLGDTVNFAGWDNEVINLIRKKDITCIQGNHDEGIAWRKTVFPFSSNTEKQKQFGQQSIHLVNERITNENRTYLSNLPFMLQLQFRFPFHDIRLAMVHGSISSNTEYVKADTKEEYLLEMMEAVNADVLLMGHTHIPYHKAIYCEEENRKIYRHAINVGSVGKPKHGNSKACYTILTINHDADLASPDAVNVQFHYVPYDVKKVIRHIKKMGLPDAYDTFLLNQ